jgi:hypothetical protein
MKGQLNVRASDETIRQLNDLAALYNESEGQVIARLIERAHTGEMNRVLVKAYGMNEETEEETWAVFIGTQLIDTFDGKEAAEQYARSDAIRDYEDHASFPARGLAGEGDPRPA